MQTEKPVPVGTEASMRWHEAVAVVRAVADAVGDGRMRGVPDSGGLGVDNNGSIHLLSGASVRATAGDDPRLASELRSLLGQLLDSEAPPALRALADGGNGAAVPASLSEFTAALAFFERPAKERDLAALAFRMAERQEERRLEAEMERLTHKTRAEERPHTSAPSLPAVIARRSEWKTRLVYALTAIVTVGATLALIALFSSMSAAQGSSKDSSAGKPSGVLATLRAVADAAFGKTETPAAPKAEPDTSSMNRRKAPRAPVRAAVGSPSAERRRTNEIYREPVPEVVEVPLSPDVAVARAPGLQANTTAIYDRRSPDVIPAELVRPHLPNVADVTGRQFGRLEVLIAEDGRVERVRLLATTIERRYYDGMLLSAVKAWVFRPASRAGQPVRYRLQIPLT